MHCRCVTMQGELKYLPGLYAEYMYCQDWHVYVPAIYQWGKCRKDEVQSTLPYCIER